MRKCPVISSILWLIIYYQTYIVCDDAFLV